MLKVGLWHKKHPRVDVGKHIPEQPVILYNQAYLLLTIFFFLISIMREPVLSRSVTSLHFSVL